MNRFFVLPLTLVIVMLAPRSVYATDPLCFDVLGIANRIHGRFHTFWELNGGLAVFGYPITSAHEE